MQTAMSRTARRTILAVIACVLASFSPRIALAAAGDPGSGSGSTGDAVPAATVPPVTANEFLPTERDLSECISSLPKPDCGSEARGGWRQALILALVLVGMAAIGARIFVAVRRRDAALVAQVAETEREAGGQPERDDGSVSRTG